MHPFVSIRIREKFAPDSTIDIIEPIIQFLCVCVFFSINERMFCRNFNLNAKQYDSPLIHQQLIHFYCVMYNTPQSGGNAVGPIA